MELGSSAGSPALPAPDEMPDEHSQVRRRRTLFAAVGWLIAVTLTPVAGRVETYGRQLTGHSQRERRGVTSYGAVPRCLSLVSSRRDASAVGQRRSPANVAVVFGRPHHPKTGYGNITERSVLKLGLMLRSLAGGSTGPMTIWMIGDDAGIRAGEELWTEVAGPTTRRRVRFRTVVVTVPELLKRTRPLVKQGLCSCFEFRIWDWAKFWIDKFLPVSRVVVLDVDTLVMADFAVLWQQAMETLNSNPKAVSLAVPEPAENFVHRPEWQNLTYVNTGVVVWDLSRSRRAGFLGRASVALKFAARAQLTKSQWPPEQWMLNTMWNALPGTLSALPDSWNHNCVGCKKGSRDCGGPPNKWKRNVTEADIVHMCNDFPATDFGLGEVAACVSRQLLP